MGIRVCALKLWLLLHVTALNTLLHPCSGIRLDEGGIRTVRLAPSSEFSQKVSDNGVPDAAVSWDREQSFWNEWSKRKYFYVHNETQIAMARAEAEALYRGSGFTAHPQSSIHGSETSSFPDFPPSEDGCNVDSVERELAFYGSDVWSETYSTRSDVIQILAVDSCAAHRNVHFGYYDVFEICSQRWVTPEKPDILIQDDPNPLARSFKVLVKITTPEMPEVLADGVYFPATGTMHLVGCVFRLSLVVPPSRDFVLPLPQPPGSESPSAQEYYMRLYDPDNDHYPPLNSSTPEDCAISATVQYPPSNSLWNTDRVLKYSIRSNRAKDDPLYFNPIERRAFLPYSRGYFESPNPNDVLQSQRRFETGGRIVLFVLGLLCVALQIEHGRDNEESLPFVSLVMIAIQIANHFSQTSIFKDLQIGGYIGGHYNRPDELVSEYYYYDLMAWSEHVPYQAMNMVGIVMYVWFFRKVGERRRITKVRVVKQRPGAEDPPSEWKVMAATLAMFAFLILCFHAFVGIQADQYDQFSRSSSRGTMDEILEDTQTPPVMITPFVSWRFYEERLAQWGVVNKVTGLVVSFFLVPQLVGNALWEVQGRPLSAWFYAGIPFLQSLPQVFLIAKHLQLLPIFPWYDPYMNSVYGVFEDPAPWWPVAVVVGSAVQVLAVHFQFSKLLVNPCSPQSRSKSTPAQV